MLAWFPPPVRAARADEEPIDAATRLAENRETIVRSTAAAFVVGEVLALIRHTLVKKPGRQPIRGRARGGGTYGR